MDSVTLTVLAVAGVVSLALVIFIIVSLVRSRKCKNQDGSKIKETLQKKSVKRKEAPQENVKRRVARRKEAPPKKSTKRVKPMQTPQVQQGAKRRMAPQALQDNMVPQSEVMQSVPQQDQSPLENSEVCRMPAADADTSLDAGSIVPQSVVMQSEPGSKPHNAQIRKKRVAADEGSRMQEEKPLFSFPDSGFAGDDPLLGDRISNAQLDHLFDSEFTPAGAPSSAPSTASSGSILFMDETVLPDADESAVLPDSESEDTGECTVPNLESEDTGECTAQPELEDEDAGKSTAQPDSGTIEFCNMHFRNRQNLVDFTKLLPERYEPHYNAGAAKLIVFHDSVKLPKQDDTGMMVLYNSHVYDGTHPKRWDNIFEVRVRRGQKVSVDLGVGVLLPEGYALQLVTAPELERKFGLQLVSGSIIGREEAANSIIVEFAGCSDVSYVAKNQSLLKCRVVKVA